MNATPQARRTPGKKVRPPPRNAQSKEVLQETFKKLSKAIREIQHKNVSKLSFEEHYRYAYNLVLYREPDMLYNGVSKLIVDHLNNEARDRIEPAFPTTSLVASSAFSAVPSMDAGPSANTAGPSSRLDASQGRVAQALEGERLLEALKGTWEDHETCMSKLRDVLKYMDKVHTEQKNLAPTYTLGLYLFLEHLLRNKEIPVQQNVLNVSLGLIRIERDGEIVNRSLLKTVTDMLCTLRETSSEGRKAEGELVYKSWWEDRFLDATRQYYTQEAEANLVAKSAPEFLANVDKRLQEESDRTATYLNPSTYPLLFSLLDQVLIESNLQAIIDHSNAGLSTLLAEDRISDLSRMYRLYGRVGSGHALLRKAVRKWVTEEGRKIVETNSSGGVTAKTSSSAQTDAAGQDDDQEGNAPVAGQSKGKGREADAAAAPKAGSAAAANTVAMEWVQALLALKDKMDAILAQAFAKDRLFQTAISDAFVNFVNEVKKAPEYISIFLDENMKRGVKGKSEAEVDAILDKTIVIFRYLTDKDVFEDYYKRHLAKRLYLGRSVSDDAERAMLQKLKLECGANFVTKLEGMLKDVGFSEELNIGYKRYLDGLGADRPTAELSVQVCTASFWPTTPDVPCILSQDFARIAKSFERYFDTRYTGRKLTWHPEHGNVDVKVRFNKGTKEINVATHGMVVLAAFENLSEGETLSYSDLQGATGLPDANLKRTLQSLACAKYKILKKDPVGRVINKGDRFAFNSAFTAPVARVKIQTIANRVENVEETKDTDERVDRERSQVIEAAIVRVMKNRKQLSHNDLITEVTGQLSRRFTPKTQMIKLAVERLIEKEYLERDDKDRKILRYLA